jgi:hypothetical protein
LCPCLLLVIYIYERSGMRGCQDPKIFVCCSQPLLLYSHIFNRFFNPFVIKFCPYPFLRHQILPASIHSRAHINLMIQCHDTSLRFFTLNSIRRLENNLVRKMRIKWCFTIHYRTSTVSCLSFFQFHDLRL